ncbi:MAG: TIGR02757 family protein, partial [Bacteroidota bacterium]|nr:TIGR02757 family protein [Bacteroidota bacterium]
IAWGQRTTIINNSWKLVRLMDEAPHEFIMHATPQELAGLDRFVHRTFNGVDLRHFILAIRHLYTEYGGIEEAFLENGNAGGMCESISRFKGRFFEIDHQKRTRKHVADPIKGSNAKRINMYLRWMVRSNDRGVDLGLWKRIKSVDLMLPLDVHTGRISRELGLLTRKQDDWKAVEELTANLRSFDQDDPVRYDIALFAMGIEAGKAEGRRS